MNSLIINEKDNLDSLVEEDLDGLMPVPPSAQSSKAAMHRVVTGTSALGTAMMIERGMGFAANVLAARFGGVTTFGAYSLGITTANNISTYAAGGIGATAARFSGKYPYGSAGYLTLARALMIVSLVSAVLASAILWFGAGPIAHIMQKDQLTTLLRWAIVSAAGIILLECARGFFVGQRRFSAVVLLSTIVGVAMLTLLPTVAHLKSASVMLLVQGCITSAAVLACLMLKRTLGLEQSASAASPIPLRPVLREVWSFGFVQLAGLVGSNLAGWWLAVLLARSDSTLAQMSFFAVASQLRNMAGIAPGLLAEGSYAVMADPDGDAHRTPHRVMALCSYVALGVALLLASAGMILMPWLLAPVYGSAYRAAGLAATIGLAIAVVHMGNAPAAARLTIVSIRSSAAINTAWAAFVGIAATLLLLHGGSAWKAMSIYFAAHLLSSVLVLATLAKKDHVPDGMMSVFSVCALSSLSLVALAVERTWHENHATAFTLIMLLILAISSVALYALGKRHNWIPPRSVFQELGRKFSTGLRSRVRGGISHV